MKQLEVQILSQSYLLGCPEGGEARLLDAVERVDTAMCRIRDAGKVRARERIAVLAALNLAFDLSDQHPPTPDNPATSHTSPSPEVSARLNTLLGKLDQALNKDDQLL